MIYLVPTRGRPDNAEELIRAFYTQSLTGAKLHFIVDQDDEKEPDYRSLLHPAMRAHHWLSWELVGTTGMVSALNFAATRYVTEIAPDEDIIGFMGDDHRPRTLGWDRMIIDALTARPGIAYGNDLLQGPNLPTQVAISSCIIRAMGHMAPSGLKHLYVDNYWKRLGTELNRLTYVSECVIEHMHPITYKAEWDDGYRRVNDGAIYAHDFAYFEEYVNTGAMAIDIEKARTVL